MEIKLQCGDTITIPEGCKAVVKDGCVVFEKEEQKFKDGDILVAVVSEERRNAFIYKGTDAAGFHLYYAGINTFGDLLINNSSYEGKWGRVNQILSHATEEEKKLLFDKMKEQRLRWNAEEKRIEKIRWRAEDGYGYFYVDNQGRKTAKDEECKFVDEDRFAFGNYFRTIEQASEAAKRVQETLMKYHEEIGE